MHYGEVTKLGCMVRGLTQLSQPPSWRPSALATHYIHGRPGLHAGPVTWAFLGMARGLSICKLPRDTMWGPGSRRPRPHRARPSFLQVLAQGLPLPSPSMSMPSALRWKPPRPSLSASSPFPLTVSATANTLCVPLVVPWLQRRLLVRPRHPDLRLTHRRESTTCRARGWGRCG